MTKGKILQLNVNKPLNNMTDDKFEEEIAEHVKILEALAHRIQPVWSTTETCSTYELRKRAERYKEQQLSMLTNAVNSEIGERALASARKYLNLDRSLYYDDENDYHVWSVVDFSMFYTSQGLHNAMTLYCNRNYNDFSKDEKNIADVSKSVTYRILQITKVVGDNGFMMLDLISDEKLLLIDNQLSDNPQCGRVLCATTYNYGEFITVNDIWFKLTTKNLPTAYAMIKTLRAKLTKHQATLNTLPLRYRTKLVATLFKKHLSTEFSNNHN